MDLDDLEGRSFRADLLESDLATWTVARCLRLYGYTITLPAIKIRPNSSQRKEYSDNGDLWIGQTILEVKRRHNINFTGLDDFPYDSVIVDIKKRVDDLKILPKYYLICNRDLTGAVMISARTKAKWLPYTIFDRTKNRERTFYICPKEHCNFWNFGMLPSWGLD